MQRSILEAKSADIVVVTKREKQNVPLSFKTFFRRAISWFTRSKGEGPTKAVHVGIIVYINEIPYVLEALWFVTLTPYDEWKREHQSFCIWRNTELSEDECIAVENEAIKYIGAFYGIAKIGLHALDGLIAKITSKEYFLFRRLIFDERYPICSWLVAYAYYGGANESFGEDYNWATPDSMWDYMKAKFNYIKTFSKTG